MRPIVAALLLSLGIACQPALSQTQNPPPPEPQTESGQQQTPAPETQKPSEEKSKGVDRQAEKKITPQEAQELFNSVDEILKFASQQSGLPIKHEVKHKLTSRDEVEKFVEQRMKEDPDNKRMEQSEFVMKKFGLLPTDFNLRKFMVAMLREQVAGYYDTKTKTMNMLDWLPPEVQKPVMAHELTHALQDQYTDLEKWQNGGKPEGKKYSLPEQLALDELRVARQSVTEGQAMLVLIDYSLVPMGRSAADAPDAVKMMEDQMMDAAGSPVFASAPLYIKRAMMFAYREGTEFEEQVLRAQGKDAAFKGTLDTPPADTREVMQPRQYLNGKHIPLLTVPNFDKLLGKSWEQMDFGALGQFDVNVLMELYADADTSRDLTPGWRGGYYYAARKKGSPSDSVAFIYVSRWSDNDVAAQFARIFTDSWKQRYKSLRAIAAPADKANAAAGKAPDTIVRKQTDQGTVSVERDENVVIVTESFPDAEAVKLRDAALAANDGTAKTTLLLQPSGFMFDFRRYTATDGMMMTPFLRPVK
ncbi:hypothetical protein Acid345_2627 [Candidatus Koribacter versatilis Ellin345]|uniref:DUF4157 domain-containing protein n=1 Tax=Koribacter versatilis (strain Ellin345) TaxID=204669 RepID=Q1INC2_KORVE|nr:hypothetical protein [Candidatus Koribacter versatilis]ABF41628.1 hypothetical protein Acid345_2627 [Candidatus Koribacter versatilis Ellin345]